MTTREAVLQVEGEVRELIRRSGLDPASDSAGVRRLVEAAEQDYDLRSLHGGMPVLGDRQEAVHTILSVVAGYGHWARGVTQALQDADVPQVVVTLSPDGAHLHGSVADANGEVMGGHVMPGCIVRTTAEVVTRVRTPHRSCGNRGSGGPTSSRWNIPTVMAKTMPVELIQS